MSASAKGSGKKSKSRKSLTPSSSPLHSSSAAGAALELTTEETIALSVLLKAEMAPQEVCVSPTVLQVLDLMPTSYVAINFPSGWSVMSRISTTSKALASFSEYKRVAVINRIWSPCLIGAEDGEEDDRSITIDLLATKRSRIVPCSEIKVQILEDTVKTSELNPIMLMAYIKEVLIGVCITDQITILLPYKGNKMTLRIHILDAPGPPSSSSAAENMRFYFEVTNTTRISILTTSISQALSTGHQTTPQLSLESAVCMVKSRFAGYNDEIKTAVKTMFTSLYSYHLPNPTIKVYKGMILSGPPGTGKSHLAQALCQALSVQSLSLDPAHLMHQPAEMEEEVRRVFYLARESAPCVILMDHMHLLVPSRSNSNVSTEMKRLVSCWLSLVDGVESLTGVFILGLTSSIDDLDRAVRRPGRMDIEIELPVPTVSDRQTILLMLLRNLNVTLVEDTQPSTSTIDNLKNNDHQDQSSVSVSQSTINYVASNAHGMVASDLLLLIKEAYYHHFQRLTPPQNNNIDSLAQTLQSLSLSISSKYMVLEDWQKALRVIKPSAIKEVAIEVPKVYWSHIGGMEKVKKAIRQVIEYPLLYPELYQKLHEGGMGSLKGVLLYGPPGCSKTLLAKAIATETSMNFLAVRGPELLSKWVGESEKAVQKLFRRARAVAPAVIFFDEIDALAGVRGDQSSGVSDRVLSQLLTELDGIEGWKQVIVIAATNRPDMLDPALIRPGRIDRKIYVPPPDDLSRRSIFQLELSKLPIEGTIDYDKLVQISCGYSGAEIVSVCNDAALLALDSNAEYVREEMLLQACQKITPQITKEMLHFYEGFRSKYRTF